MREKQPCSVPAVLTDHPARMSPPPSCSGLVGNSVHSTMNTRSILDSPVVLKMHIKCSQRTEVDVQQDSGNYTFEFEDEVVHDALSCSTKWKRIIAYGSFVSFIFFTGTVLLLTVPEGNCEDGCEEKACKQRSERQQLPCTCFDINEQIYCAKMVLSKSGESHKNAAWILLAITGFLVVVVPCISYWFIGLLEIIQRARGKYSAVYAQEKYREAALS